MSLSLGLQIAGKRSARRIQKIGDRQRQFWIWASVTASLCLALFAPVSLAQSPSVATLTSLTSFAGTGVADGAYPTGRPIRGRDGNLYGTTRLGGPGNFGTVYKLTPSGERTTIHAFALADGAYPYGALVQGRDGAFYGTTESGGDLGLGTVYKITPSGKLTTLHTFQGEDGASPDAALALGDDGNYYGTTKHGGANLGDGTIFKISPLGRFTSLHTFAGGPDGANPMSELLKASDGNFYGTTFYGGAGNGSGTVFKITPEGVLTKLYIFTGGADGAWPGGGLVQGNDGYLYGTTLRGGVTGPYFPSGCGTIYRITPWASLQTLYSFTGDSNGCSSAGALIQANDGALFGSASGGAVSSACSMGCGTIFMINTSGMLTTLHAFSSDAEGGGSGAGLTQVSDGTIFGISQGGGTNSLGTVYRLDVALPPGFPTNVTATATAFGKIKLKWTATPGATGYNVYQGTISDQQGDVPVLSNVTQTSVTIKKLEPRKTYYFKVAAANAYGFGPRSNETSADTR